MDHIQRNSFHSVEEIVLNNLGIHSRYDINDWYKRFYADAYKIDMVDDACRLILSYSDRAVHIMGDYDVDGRCAVTILEKALLFLGFSNVSVRVPKAFSEGYGMRPSMIDEISEENALIITVDNGIASLDAIQYAKEKGHAVIVTDHHLPVVEDGKVVLPAADILIDPNAIPDSADYSAYCGAGLAYKIARALLPLPEAKELLDNLLVFAAVATICDVVELREENYVFVRKGLDILNKGRGPAGIRALIDVRYLSDITSDKIAFQIGPCLNAPRRLYDEDRLTLPLLAGDASRETYQLAEQTVLCNNTRKARVKTAKEEAFRTMAENHMEEDCPLVLYIPDIGEGIVGIIAGQLCETFAVPVLVFTDSDDPLVLRGSGRSTPDINLKELLDTAGSFFTEYGGHAGAAGMSVLRKNLDALRAALNENAKIFHREKIEADTFFYDLEIAAEDVQKTLEAQDLFEPYGEGNPKPVYKVTGFVPSAALGKITVPIGENGVKLKNADGVTAISYDMRDALNSYPFLRKIDFYGTLSWNVFRGTRTPQIEFQDFVVHDTMNRTSLSEKLKSIASSAS